MDKKKYASLASQLGNAVCDVEDTEEMFWLRECDDYDSKVKLGNALSVQYRYKEAIDAYRTAMMIRSDDKMLYIRLAGALLTLGRFEEALTAYNSAVRYGATEKSIAYYMGVWHYLKGEYADAAEWFRKCLPCGDEMAIAVIYWHTLSCARLGIKPNLLGEMRADMQIGHHTAYLSALRVFDKTIPIDEALTALAEEKSDLNFAVTAYGICVYLETVGRITDAESLRAKLLEKESVWSCISYLAAMYDAS